MKTLRKLSAVVAAQAADARSDIGALPRWNLGDLYDGMEAPAFTADLKRAEHLAERFADRYRGRLAALAEGPGAGVALTEAIRAFETLEDLLGRVASFASLVYTEDTSDPRRTKFFSDAQDRVTAI